MVPHNITIRVILGPRLKIRGWKIHFGKIYSLVISAILEEVPQTAEGFSSLREILHSTGENLTSLT